MFYVDLYIINVYVILPPDLGSFAVNKCIHTYKSSRMRWYGHVERMQNQGIPKQIAAATIEGTRKRGRPRERLKEEVEEGLNVMGIKNGRAAARDRRKWRKIVLLAKVHNGQWRLRRRRRYAI
jgi:hypothetical protein